MRRRRATLDYFKHKDAEKKESKLAFSRHVSANGSPMQWGGGVKIILFYSLEKENKSLKNEIKGIYRGFNQFMENTLGATVRQAEKLMNNLVSEIKEFVKGGEFEKIHRNETRTRDRDELSR